MKRINSYDRESLITLLAIESLLKGYERQFKTLSDRVKYGWRDFRLIEYTISRLNENLLKTVPESQIKTIANHAKSTSIRISTTRVSKPDDDNWVISRDDLETLINYAAEGHCLMCTNKDGRGCRLRQLIEECPVEMKVDCL